MTTLKEMYKDLIRDPNEWSYYCSASKSEIDKLLKIDTLCCENDSYEFIKNYFFLGGKEALFNDSYIKKNTEILKNRAPHIVSTYLLGFIIAKSFKIDTSLKDSNNINFKYLWFLACLYHDIGYIYEGNSCCKYLREIQTNGLSAIKEICNIDYLDNCEFQTFTKEHVNIYLSHRAKCADGKMGVIDHGIAGGLMLYDRLMQNYKHAWEAICKNDNKNSEESFTFKNLHFSNKHFKYYSIAADAVISHNIWLSTLNTFLAEENKKVIEKPMINRCNQIAFILALADTIEPMKKNGFSSLNTISYEDTDNGFRLSMPYHNSNDTYSYISDLATWVDITVKKENNTFLITEKE